MRVAELCSTQTVVCSRQTSIEHCAQMMRDHHVGDLVVADDSGGAAKPVGIVTDRDIVVAVVAQGLAPRTILAGDIMSSQLLSVAGDADPLDAIATMQYKGVSRLPVVDADGNLAGIVSSADLFAFLTREMAALAGVRHRQTVRETHTRP